MALDLNGVCIFVCVCVCLPQIFLPFTYLSEAIHGSADVGEKVKKVNKGSGG